MYFSENYPSKAPLCRFEPPLYHPNVYANGQVCLSIINEEGWVPGITVKQILQGIQDLLTNPNPQSPAQESAFKDYILNRATYNRKIKEQAGKNVPDC